MAMGLFAVQCVDIIRQLSVCETDGEYLRERPSLYVLIRYYIYPAYAPGAVAWPAPGSDANRDHNS